jgi:hypothetical protein
MFNCLPGEEHEEHTGISSSSISLIVAEGQSSRAPKQNFHAERYVSVAADGMEWGGFVRSCHAGVSTAIIHPICRSDCH